MNLKRIKNQVIPSPYKKKYLNPKKTRKTKAKVRQEKNRLPKRASGGSVTLKRSQSRKTVRRNNSQKRNNSQRRNTVSRKNSCGNRSYNFGDAILKLFS
jgi:hypothetical protein